MSENRDRGPRDYSRYDSMSTEELKEILRLEAHRADGAGLDTEELFYIMEVVTKRRKSNPETAGKSLEESKAEFRKHYMPGEKSRTIVFPTWLRRVTAAVVALAVFGAITVSVNAFGYDLWGKVATWTQEFFHFEDETQGTESREPDKQNNYEYASLQDALDASGIQQKLAPTWLPDGYVLSEVTVTNTPRETSIYAYYTRGNQELSISIRRLIGSAPEEIEKSESAVLAYDVNGITYYILNNYEEMKATWVVGEFECYIAGRITTEELKTVINSI